MDFLNSFYITFFHGPNADFFKNKIEILLLTEVYECYEMYKEY